MLNPLLLLPDFALIALGFALSRVPAFGRPVWTGIEKLVYYVLFPALLFHTIARSPLAPAQTLALVGGGVCVVGLGIVLTLALRAWPGIDQARLASGAQTAFRFNSYIALALAERLGGTQGLAWMALLVAVCVPLCNVAAVLPLARLGGQGLWGELLRNPLILSTVGGLAWNLLRLPMPEVASITLQRIGAAALPLGLMAVGAGLQWGALRQAPGLAAALLAIRHAALPLAALGLVLAFGLPPAQSAVLLVFAALPTASSAYVLAVRMGGDGAFVAGLVTVSTLLAMLSLPLALAALSFIR